MSAASHTRVGKIGKSTITLGRFTCVEQYLSILQWDEGSNLEIGSFCSIADNITIILGVLSILRGLELDIPYISPAKEALQLNSMDDHCM